MKTAMQELLEWVRKTLPMDLDYPQMIEAKIESLLPKERRIIIDAFDDGNPNGFIDKEGVEYFTQTYEQ
jgi:hypothetical protein